MSYLWWFKSFDKAGFDTVFAAKAEANRSRLAGALEDIKDWCSDFERLETLAVHLGAHGIDYSKLSEEDGIQLDELLPVIFSGEIGQVEDLLKLEYESPDGVHYSTIKELESRMPATVAAPRLQWLKQGRRENTRELRGDYLILSPKEQQALLGEVLIAFESDKPWSHDDHKVATKSYLIDVLQSIIAKRKFCFAHQG